jgi:hypothetical protein
MKEQTGCEHWSCDFRHVSQADWVDQSSAAGTLCFHAALLLAPSAIRSASGSTGRNEWWCSAWWAAAIDSVPTVPRQAHDQCPSALSGNRLGISFYTVP